MRLFGKITLIIAILFLVTAAVLYGLMYAFVAKQGKALTVQQLENTLHRKVSIGSLHFIPPYNFQARNINIEGIMKADAIYVAPSIASLIERHLVLNEIKVVSPEFVFKKEAVKVPEASISAETKPQETQETKPEEKLPALKLLVKHVKIKNGILHFTDYSVGDNALKVTVDHINLSLNNFGLLKDPVITNFLLRADLPWQDERKSGKILAEGWLNFSKKDLQAKLRIIDIDAIAFYPYYASWVDKEKARIEKAKLNFQSDIQALNNNLNAVCRLELTEIVFKPREEDEPQERMEKITFAVLDILKTMNQGTIFLDFNIKTKLDKPQFNLSDIRMAFEDKISRGRDATGFKTEDVLKFPGRLIEGTVKGATDITKGVIDGTISAGKELKQAFEGSFKKETKEAVQEEGPKP